MRTKTIVAAALFFCWARMATAETVEEVTKKIGEMTAKHESMQYTTKTQSNIKQEGMTVVSKSSGKTWYMKQGDEFLMRTEDQSETVTEVMGNKMTNKSDTLMVQDGQFIWTLDKTQKTAMKMKMPKDQKTNFDPRETWKDFNLKLLPEQTIDGKPTWVIEAAPKDPQMKAATGKTILWYEKATGLTLKTESYDKDDKPIMTATMNDYKINEKLDPNLFKFEAPAGVQVQDLTSLPG